jgi:hypothetical protein
MRRSVVLMHGNCEVKLYYRTDNICILTVYNYNYNYKYI